MQSPETRSTTNLPPVALAYNGKDRNAFLILKQNCGMVASL